MFRRLLLILALSLNFVPASVVLSAPAHGPTPFNDTTRPIGG